MKTADFISRLTEENIRKRAKLLDEAVDLFLLQNNAPTISNETDQEKLEKAGFILKATENQHQKIKLELFRKVAACEIDTEVSLRSDSFENKIVVITTPIHIKPWHNTEEH